jgi:hypothetical protein
MMEMTESCEHKVPREDSCCKEDIESDIYITAYDQCCSATIVDPSLKENYLGSKNEISQRTEFLILDFKQEDSSLKLSFNKIKINISPPFSAFQKLYLINSILLI